jgi:CheY-like chemotaxis protein
LVELHGGTIEAKSPGVGGGATFRVALPLTVLNSYPAEGQRRPSPSAASSDPSWISTDLKGAKVLVVDDDPDSRQLLKRLLEDCGAQVTMTGSVLEALSSIDRDRFDVIVSDIGMPHRDGYDFIRELRSRPSDRGGATPAIALTAFARSEDRTRAMLAGFDLHVSKPVELKELCAVVSRLTVRVN